MTIELLSEWIAEYLATISGEAYPVTIANYARAALAEFELNGFIQWIKENKLS